MTYKGSILSCKLRGIPWPIKPDHWYRYRHKICTHVYTVIDLIFIIHLTIYYILYNYTWVIYLYYIWKVYRIYPFFSDLGNNRVSSGQTMILNPPIIYNMWSEVIRYLNIINDLGKQKRKYFRHWTSFNFSNKSFFSPLTGLCTRWFLHLKVSYICSSSGFSWTVNSQGSRLWPFSLNYICLLPPLLVL